MTARALASRLAAFGLLATLFALAPDTPAGAAEPPNLTAADVGAWADGLMGYAIRTGDIAGAELVIVKDGQILLARGYGYADVAARRKVDPATTLFRPGSISKLFTYTAVMQLVEQGKLALDHDINDYLDFRIPPYAGKPVTLRQILTHTAGFEEVGRDIITVDPARFTDLRTALTRFVPTRIFPPGEVPAYSNYAAALAGYIVQRASGEAYESYVEHHILAPLGMDHATFHQPPPGKLAAEAALGYDTASQPPKNFEYISLAPAGALSASGEAMAHFMIAHLEDGAYGTTRILKPETARMMHGTITRFFPPLNGIALGFAQADINGQPVIAHGGDTLFFHSGMWLFTAAHVGVYVSCNSIGADGASDTLRRRLFEEFAARYFPRDIQDGAVDPNTARSHAALMAGHYLGSRRADDTLLAASNLFGQFEIAAAPDGGLYAGGKTWHEIAPFVWREDQGRNRIAAVLRGGKPVALSLDSFAYGIAFQPAPLRLDAAWLLPAAFASLTVVLLTAMSWPVLAFARWRYGVAFALHGADAWTYRASRAASILILLASAALLWLASVAGDAEPPSPRAIRIVMLLLPLTTLSGLAGGTANLLTAFTHRTAWGRRLWSSLMLAACGVLAWIAYAFGLLTLNVNY